MLGLEVRDAVVVAVAVDEHGAVLARAEQTLGDDPASAALDAVGRLAGASTRAGVAVAAINTDGPSTAAVLRALRARDPGAGGLDRAIPSGTAAAVAEAWAGAARGARDVAFLAASDHTSAGIVRAGVPEVGAHGRAAAIAWLALNPVEREDYRKAGCLEAEVAASGIVRRLVWRIKAGDASRVQEMVNNDLAAITLQHVLDGARQQDGVSISVLRDTGKYLGMAAANLVVIADPDALVLGGIMADAPDLLFDLVKTEIARRLPEPAMKALAIAPAALGADAAAIGAARLSQSESSISHLKSTIP